MYICTYVYTTVQFAFSFCFIFPTYIPNIYVYNAGSVYTDQQWFKVTSTSYIHKSDQYNSDKITDLYIN